MSEQATRTGPSTVPRTGGVQTLARGLRALELVCESPGGVAVTEVATCLGVHRSIASRLLATLTDFGLVTRGPDGRYRSGARLATLAAGLHRTLRELADPVLRDLAQRTGANAGLMVAEGEEAVGLAMVAPPIPGFQILFGTGRRHSLTRGADGIVLRALEPPRDTDPPEVVEARRRGWALSHGEVEPGAHGLAVALPRRDGFPPSCLVLVSLRRDQIESCVPALQAAAAELDALLR